MALVITGMGLSLQRFPSISNFTDILISERNDPPVMVEHPGEVILQALHTSSPQNHSSLLIVHTAAVPEYGYYIARLEDLFGEVKLDDSSPIALVDVLMQVDDLLIKDPNLSVVISETTSTGTSSIALANPKHGSDALARLMPPTQNSTEKINIELAGFAGDINEGGIKQLESLVLQSAGKRPISLCQPGPYRQSKESVLSLIHLVLAVKNKIIPSWVPPHDLSSLVGSVPGLVFNEQSLPWLASGKHFKRSAALVGQSQISGDWQSVQIVDIPSPTNLSELRHVNGVDPYLFLICGETQSNLIEELDKLESALKQRKSLSELAHYAYAQYSLDDQKFTCCLLAATREALEREIQHAKTGLPEAFSSLQDWISPAGSYFTPLPLRDAEIALVYPGAFNSYQGMGKGLFFSFPGLQDALLEIIPDPRQSLAEDLIYPTGQTESDPGAIFNHPGKLIESGVSLSTIYSLILDQVYNLKPAAAFGYSLGEISMLWANRIWKNAHESSTAWKESTLFTEQLSGKMLVIREAWEDQTLPQDFWGSFILKASADIVRTACEKEDCVSLTIQNTSDEVVIAGEKNACKRIIKELGCHALPMPLNTAIHHPAVQSSQGSFESLFSNPVTPRDDIRFYSAATYNQLTLNPTELTTSMAEMICSPFNFPRLVNQVYEDGARIFIETGPQKTCTRWIEKILKDKPHAVIPLNKKYQSDLHGILKVLSLLLSHGSKLNLTSLFRVPDKIQGYQHGRENGGTTQEIPLRKISRQPAMVLEFTENLDRISVDMAAGHQEFLTQQSVLTRSLTRVLELQAEAIVAGPLKKSPDIVLFSRDQIKAFTNGDHRVCFGDQFSGFGDRRFPRLPNGPLQFIDRVIRINGEAGKLRPGSAIVTEIDLPQGSWYQQDQSTHLPHVALMEIALQPCGFLSAYSGSIQGREDQDLYFRNLDGEGNLLFWPISSELKVTNKARLISSSNLDNVIIQKYSFELFQGEDLFFQGNSSFGYFPLPMLQNQAGLDGNEPASTWKKENPQSGNWQEVHSDQHANFDSQNPHLPRVEQLWIARQGGIHNQGYIFLEQEIPEDAWFYRAHFYQDPVMPGSLGVETMAQALMAASSTWNVSSDLIWRIKPGSKLTWKYRGQITPDIKKINLEMHIKSVSRGPECWEICADGYLLKNDSRIYQIDNLCLEALAAD